MRLIETFGLQRPFGVLIVVGSLLVVGGCASSRGSVVSRDRAVVVESLAVTSCDSVAIDGSRAKRRADMVLIYAVALVIVALLYLKIVSEDAH